MKHKLKPLVLLTALLFGSVSVSYAQDLNKGLEAYNRGDYTEAIREWEPLAELGYSKAQYNLGILFDEGKGVPQDYKAAVKWYRLAAEQGLVNAQYNLGQSYDDGEGVIQDYKAAVKWYRLAAEQGHAKAQYMLGAKYGNGEGVPMDFVLAHMWFNIAASNGLSEAFEARDFAAGQITLSDISKAQQMARECVKRNYKSCD